MLHKKRSLKDKHMQEEKDRIALAENEKKEEEKKRSKRKIEKVEVKKTKSKKK